MKKFDFNINGDDFQVNIKNSDSTQVELEVNGTPYTVLLKKEIKQTKTPVLVRKESASKAADIRVVENMTPVSDGAKPSSKSIKSPLPGSIIKVLVNEGDTFSEGDVIMIMESMKMENNIIAERGGTVVKVCAPAGSSVLQDADLILFQ